MAVAGTSQLTYTLKELPTNLVAPEDADVIVSDSSSIKVDALPGKSYVGIGINALNAVKNSGILSGFDFDRTRNGDEGLVKAKVNEHVLVSGYVADELLYTTNVAWITSVSEDAEILAFSVIVMISMIWLVAGHNDAKGQIMAFTQNFGDSSITLFANDLAFRGQDNKIDSQQTVPMTRRWRS